MSVALLQNPIFRLDIQQCEAGTESVLPLALIIDIFYLVAARLTDFLMIINS